MQDPGGEQAVRRLGAERRAQPVAARRERAAGELGLDRCPGDEADAEAAAAWQTALIDGSDLPQIYEWLGDTLARTHDYTAARSILEEAVGRWPSDTRFGRTLALSYATLGEGRDAIRTLGRYVADGHAEPDLLFLMVEWLFQVHNNRAVVINGAADLTMARNYAAQYAKADGPKQPLVQQWVEFLANEKR